MMAPDHPTALVVGAGLSGLVAARRLLERGWRVRFVEAESVAGGSVKTFRRDGFLIDTGADAMTEAYSRFLALVKEAGLGDQLAMSSNILGVIKNNRLIEIDPAHPIKALCSPILSTGGKLRFARGLFAIRKQIGATSAFGLRAHAALDDPMLDARQRSQDVFGEEVTKYLLDPILQLVAGARSDTITSLILPAALSSGSAKMVTLQGGLDILPTSLAATLPVEFDSRVVSIEEDRSAGGLQFRLETPSGPEDGIADVAIIATPIHVAARISPALHDAVGELLGELPTVGLITVSMAYARPTRTQAYLVNLPSVEGRSELALLLQHNKADDRAPRGSSLITTYLDDAAMMALENVDDDTIGADVRSYVESVMPELKGSHRFTHVQRWPYAGPYARPGYYRLVDEVARRLEQVPRIRLAGDFWAAGSMEAAVRSGEAAAEHIQRDFGRRHV
ncbi:Protoporphyrinogen oxidase [Sphingobium faniae]|nr:Protoporphyrinogen oxidase [Sphingobium faniae]